MDKDRITTADIDMLLKASRELKPGEMVIGSLQSSIKTSSSGEPKVVKAFISNKKTNGQIIDFPAVSSLIGEGIKGEAIIDAFKNAQVHTERKPAFILERTFFKIKEETEIKRNMDTLNRTINIYKYDEFGRVYIISDDKRIYLDKTKKHGITEDGYFVDLIIKDDGGVDVTYYNSEEAVYKKEFIDFDYLYVSMESARRGEEIIAAEEERISNQFISENPLPETAFTSDTSMDSFEPERGKIINLNEYRENIEEGPKR